MGSSGRIRNQRRRGSRSRTNPERESAPRPGARVPAPRISSPVAGDHQALRLFQPVGVGRCPAFSSSKSTVTVSISVISVHVAPHFSGFLARAARCRRSMRRRRRRGLIRARGRGRRRRGGRRGRVRGSRRPGRWRCGVAAAGGEGGRVDAADDHLEQDRGRGPRRGRRPAGRSSRRRDDHVLQGHRRAQHFLDQLAGDRAAPARAVRRLRGVDSCAAKRAGGRSLPPAHRMPKPHEWVEIDAMTYNADTNRYDGKMVYRRTGRSGLDLPVLSLGYWHNFGDDRKFETQREIARRAFDLGITHHDLANNYGPPYGAAEVNFGRLMREDFRPYRDEMVDLDQGGLGHVAGPLRPGRRRAQVRALLARPVAAADGPRLRRHLLLAPARRLDPAGGDDGRARHRRPPGQGALRRHLLLRRRAHPQSRRDPRRPRHAAPDPPAELLDAEPLDRGRGAARRGRRARRRRDRLHRPRPGPPHRQIQRRHPGGLAGDPEGLRRLRHRLDQRRGDRPGARARTRSPRSAASRCRRWRSPGASATRG